MGAYDGSENLSPVNYTLFASKLMIKDQDLIMVDYVTTVIKHARDEWHIPVTTIDPFNEPRFGWHPVKEGQEGNRWAANSQRDFIPILKSALQEQDLADHVKISVSDDYSVFEALDTLNELGGPIANTFKANVHGYPRMTGPSYAPESFTESWNSKVVEYESRIRKTIPTLWMSETGGYGFGNEGICDFGYDVMRHLNLLRADAWIYWQVMDKVPQWGLFITSTRYPWWFSKWNYRPVPTVNFYTMKQFSGHIRPGYRILKHSRSDVVDYCHVCMVAAISDMDATVVIVLLNNMSRTLNHTVDISSVKEVRHGRTQVRAFRTCAWSNDNYTEISSTIVLRNNGQMVLPLFAFSIATIEIF